MTEVYRKIYVDLSRKTSTRLVFARQNDVGSRNLLIGILDDGVPYNIADGTTASLNYKREDGERGAVALNDFADGMFQAEIPQIMIACAGEVKCSVSLYDSKKNRITSSDFIIDVSEEHYSGEAIESSPEYSLIDALFTKVSECIETEEIRVAEESARANAENLRCVAETERTVAESIRKTAETQRADAENGRVSAETQRADAENGRVSAENQRVVAENERAEAEDARRLAEIERNSQIDRKINEKLGISGQVIISVGRWNSNLQTTVEISGLGIDDLVIFYPSTDTDRDEMSGCEVFVEPVCEGEKVYIHAGSKPSVNIALEYYIIRGKNDVGGES